MLYITALGVGTGIACGIWAWIGPILNLSVAAGFAGTTTYFACPPPLEGVGKIPKCFAGNLTGYLYAMLSMYLTSRFGGELFSIFMTGLISFLMCYQNRFISYLDYIPAAFMGCFTTFLTGGAPNTLPSMIVGYVVALGCDYGARLVFKYFGKKEN